MRITIAQQAALFHSIKPLFANKPWWWQATKRRTPLEDVSAEDRALIDGMREAMRGPASMELATMMRCLSCPPSARPG